MAATVVIDVVLLAMGFLLLPPSPRHSVFLILIPTMVILFVALPFLAVDRDRLRIRALLSANLPLVVEATCDRATADRVQPESALRTQGIILANAAVQRRIPPAALWALDFVLLVVGALLGQRFAQDFAPPDLGPEWAWAVQTFAVLVPVAIAGFILLNVRIMARLDQAQLTLFGNLVGRPDLWQVYLPFHSERFSRAFDEDLAAALALASGPPETLLAIVHFVPGARLSRAWQPDNLLDLSFTLGQLGIGLILGAVFQVFAL